MQPEADQLDGCGEHEIRELAMQLAKNWERPYEEDPHSERIRDLENRCLGLRSHNGSDRIPTFLAYDEKFNLKDSHKQKRLVDEDNLISTEIDDARFPMRTSGA